MKRTMVNFYVTDEELKQIDIAADKMGMTRAAYIRYMLIYKKEDK